MKTKLNISKKALQWAVLFGFLCSVFCSFASFDASCEDLRHNVLRLHIVANSDSTSDQALKLKIRDAILKESEDIFAADGDFDSALATAKGNVPHYNEIANRVIRAEGFDYTAQTYIGKAFFETRVYDEYTLPSGNYDSLIINIGKAKGKNWWCVIFPTVCLPTTDAKLSDSVEDTSAQITQNSGNYIIRFKTVELYEKIKRFFD